MNDISEFPDGGDFEALLRTRTPRIDPVAQQDLLYQCAFRAGLKRGRGAARVWQSGTLILALALTVSWLVRPQPEQSPIAQSEPPRAILEPETQPAPREPLPGIWNLAADSQREEEAKAFEKQWERIARYDARDKQLSLARIAATGLLDR